MAFDETEPFLADMARNCVKAVTGLVPANVSFRGIFDLPGTTIAFGGLEIVSEEYSLTYATNDVDLQEGHSVTIDGDQGGVFKVWKRVTLDDGVFSLASLRRTG